MQGDAAAACKKVALISLIPQDIPPSQHREVVEDDLREGEGEVGEDDITTSNKWVWQWEEHQLIVCNTWIVNQSNTSSAIV